LALGLDFVATLFLRPKWPLFLNETAALIGSKMTGFTSFFFFFFASVCSLSPLCACLDRAWLLSIQSEPIGSLDKQVGYFYVWITFYFILFYFFPNSCLSCAADHVGASLTLLLFVLGVCLLGTCDGFFQRHEALVWHDKVGCICGLRGGIKDRAGLGNTQES
jgi:hypothetical protein